MNVVLYSATGIACMATEKSATGLSSDSIYAVNLNDGDKLFQASLRADFTKSAPRTDHLNAAKNETLEEGIDNKEDCKKWGGKSKEIRKREK